MLAAPVAYFAEVDRPAVAELAGPVAELVAAVAHGMGVHPREQLVAGEDFGEPVTLAGGCIKIEKRGRSSSEDTAENETPPTTTTPDDAGRGYGG